MQERRQGGARQRYLAVQGVHLSTPRLV
jgi:hypothetical protein